MSVPEPRGTTERGEMAPSEDLGIQLAVLATEVRLSKDHLGAGIAGQTDEIRALRSEMTNNYVSLAQHTSDMSRLTDRIGGAESDVLEIRTSLATQFVDVHTHIDRRFNEIAQQRRWSISQAIAVGTALLMAGAGLVTTLIEVGAH